MTPTKPLTAGDALIDAIADRVATKLQKWSGDAQRLMTLEVAAAYMGMTSPALRHRKDVPVVKIDSHRRYDRRDLDRIIDQAPREGV